MIYMVSWRGLGVYAFVSIWVAVGFLVVGLSFGEIYGFRAFALGWLAVGIGCFVVGRRVNREVAIHRFCNFKLQTWGVIYTCIGLFFGMLVVSEMRARYQFSEPIRPATRVSTIDISRS